ncbi:MAG: bifunctional nuclease family protein [Acidimicrobiales bacterium]
MIELEVVDIATRPMSVEERQRMRDEAVPLAGQPPPAPGARVVEVVDGPRWEHEVTLKERDGERVLGITIGQPEAIAIGFGLLGHLEPRPMTHDFIGSLLRALDDLSVRQLVITERERGTFHARLEVQHRDRMLGVDCRPSDGIAVAVRLGVPILAADELEPLLTA